ncbi:MAG: hypothetical protein HC852_01780 [Acaryochloridaceae cyanobacterium RU_4_10]|nr:hypothetical protein [Acaryochloridaceae cyanobacterium RU_4_10]
MNRLQHLTEALTHLSCCNGFELEVERIRRIVLEELNRDTADLRGRALIDRLTDEELAIAIRIRDERLELYFGAHIEPFTFNYIRSERPIAAIEFSRRG